MTKKLSSRITALVVVGLMAAGLAACSSGGSSGPAPTISASADQASLDQLVAQAKTDGTVNWYFGLTGDSVQKIVNAFQQQYPGITVSVTSNSAAAVQAQFLTEAQAGNVHADDVSVGYSDFYPQIVQAGYAQSMDSVISGFDQTYPSAYLQGNGITGIWTATPNGFAYNSNLVPSGSIPATFADLENPIYKGHIVAPNPNASITYLEIWDFLQQSLGTDGVKKIIANLQPTLYTSFPTELAPVAAGSAWIGLMAGQATVAPLVTGGAPLKYVTPQQVTGSAYANAVSAKAPHPAAAKLFSYWLYSADGQKAVAAITGGGGPLVPNSLPQEFVLPNFNATTQKDEINALLGITS